MNQFPSVSPDLDGLDLNPAVISGGQVLGHSRDILPSTTQTAPYLIDLDGMACWSKVYDLRGGALQPLDAEDIFPGFLKGAEAERAKTAKAVEEAIATERNRLSRELHDAVTQTLFAASLLAELLPDLWESDEAEARKSTEELRRLTRGAHAEMRTLLLELRPSALSQARLPDLLKQLSEAVSGRRQLPIDLDVQGDREIPCDVKVEMYRIVQESLNNIVKYARASKIDISARLEANHVHIEIKDNGIGFDPSSVKPASLGLRMMRERAEAIRARLRIHSQPGSGTTIVLDWQG